MGEQVERFSLAVAQHTLRQHGTLGVLSRLVAVAERSIARLVHIHERHVWYTLDLAARGAHAALPAGFELFRAGADDLAQLEGLETVGGHEARQRIAAGAELWLLCEGERTAFACWIFSDDAPVFAARKGRLTLPSDIVCLEDSITAPAYRGGGLASAAWQAIARRLESEHRTAIITKVAEDNAASRRAVEKAGFAPVAMMTLTRRGFRVRVTMDTYHRDRISAHLTAALAR